MHTLSLEYECPDDGELVDIVVRFTASKGSPAFYDPAIGGPGGWSPGDGPEIDIRSVAVVTNGAHLPAPAEIVAWAEAEADRHPGMFLDEAAADSEPDPDLARDDWMEDRRLAREFADYPEEF